MDRQPSSPGAGYRPFDARPFGGAHPGRALLERRVAALNAELLHHDSATLALERWCRANGRASLGAVAVRIVSAADAAPTIVQQRRLRISPSELVRQRRVRLLIGQRVLSVADNWYVPGRLTRVMRWRLDLSTVPFGRVVSGLRFRRLRLADEPLWRRSETAPEAAQPPNDMAGFVLRHRALLLRADGLPFSEVVESYTQDALFLDHAA